MISRLKLTNFRKVADDTMTFTSGINVIRGANEASKSTRLEGIAYALFGSRSLRTSLEQAATHGESPNSLKVELDIEVGGKTYQYKRSKSGAEVTVNGTVFCTGQTEVTKLSASLMGADAAVAGKLLLAGQGSIRGALEDGAAALSALIEELADMSLFDQVLEAASERLALGSPALLEARLKGAQDTLEAASQNLPPKPDEGAFVSAQTERWNRKHALDESLPQLVIFSDDASAAWQHASRAYIERLSLEQVATNALNALRLAQNQVAQLPVVTVVDTSPIARLQQEISEAEDHTKRLEAYKVFQSIPDGAYWVGNQESFEAASKKCTTAVQDLKSQIQAVTHEIKTAEGEKFKDHKCNKCGQDLPNLDFIHKKNTEVAAKVAKLELAKAKLLGNLEEAQRYEAAYAYTATFAKQCMPLFRKLSGYSLFDDDTYPMKVVWKGSVPEGVAPDTLPLRKQIADIETEVKRQAAIASKLELASEQLKAAQAARDKATKTLNEHQSPDSTEVLKLTAAKDQALETLTVAKGNIILVCQEIDAAAASHNQALTLWKMAQARIDDAQKTIDACQSDLQSLTYNNGFVKRIRAIRPVIANKLWSTVLASVSVMFSQMRKEESWVTKEKSGFAVNGQAVESLSGSTLDLLGLAVRCALLRTFLPQCGLLVLDEPMAACDTDRAESMLGFLKSVDFAQTILVSHEEVSESVADNLIVL